MIRRRAPVRSLAAVVTACALLAAGCGDAGEATTDAPEAGADDAAEDRAASPQGDQGDDGASPGEAPAGSDASGGDGGSGASPPPSDRGGGAAAPPPSTGSGSDGDASFPATLDASGAPGSFAGDLLRPARSASLVVEVAAQSGAAPRGATLQHVRSVLAAVSGKGTIIDGPAEIPGGGRDWTPGQLRAEADRRARRAQGGGRAVLRLLFVRGTLGGDDSVLGVAVRGDVAAVFSDQVAAAGGLLSGSGPIEDAVTMHEVGHLLGLVDLFLDTGRADPEHPGHSRSQGSVMFWAVESSLVTEVLTGGPPRDFDDADRADLARIRAG